MREKFSTNTNPVYRRGRVGRALGDLLSSLSQERIQEYLDAHIATETGMTPLLDETPNVTEAEKHVFELRFPTCVVVPGI